MPNADADRLPERRVRPAGGCEDLGARPRLHLRRRRVRGRARSTAAQPFRMPQHLARLQYSLDGIRLANPHTDAQWDALIARADRAASRSPTRRVYLQITRGVAKRDHAFPAGRHADGVHDEQSARRCRRASRSSAASPSSPREDNRWHALRPEDDVAARQRADAPARRRSRRRRDGDVPRRPPDRGVGVERADRPRRHASSRRRRTT